MSINWLVGFGTGFELSQIAPQQQVVANFNASHPDIHLTLEVVEHSVALDTFDQRLADGNPPDLVGPMGITALGRYRDELLGLDPATTPIDLSKYPESQIAPFRADDGTLQGVPIGLYPSFLYYNRNIFDKAGLPYPPKEFGQPYRGKTWDTDNLRETALLLTLDSTGRNATDPAFDPAAIVQWGFIHQYSDSPRDQAAFFGAGSLLADDGSATIPAHWQAEWQWYYDMIWKDHSVPNATEQVTALLDNGAGFGSQNIAMGFSHIWYLPLLKDEKGVGHTFFDFAVVPEYQGTVTSKVNADVIAVTKKSKNPAEAQIALAYLMGDAAAELVKIYGPIPARVDLQADFLAGLQAAYPAATNWSVITDSLAYPDLPSSEQLLPYPSQATDLLTAFGQELNSNPNLDVAGTAQQLRDDLTDLFVNGPAPAPSMTVSTP